MCNHVHSAGRVKLRFSSRLCSVVAPVSLQDTSTVALKRMSLLRDQLF